LISEPDLTIRSLREADAAALVDLLSAQPPEYARFFTPFPFESPWIESMLRNRVRDGYFGVWSVSRLVAFFMLRGWDAGYEVPSYGVVVDYEHRGLGLARLTLAASKAMCRMMGSSRLMLKVHPENEVAIHAYESEGFVRTGRDDASGQFIYHFELQRQPFPGSSGERR
jgi:RimJ/RimL family protein N-acetyltransferase